MTRPLPTGDHSAAAIPCVSCGRPTNCALVIIDPRAPYSLCFRCIGSDAEPRAQPRSHKT